MFSIQLSTEKAKSNVDTLNTALDETASKSDKAASAISKVGQSDTENFKKIAKAAKDTGKQAEKLKAAANQFARISRWLQKSATNSAQLSTNLDNMSRTISQNMIVYKAYTSALAGSVYLMQQLQTQTGATSKEMNNQKTAVGNLSTKYQGLNRTLGTTSRRFTQLGEAMKNSKKYYGSGGRGGVSGGIAAIGTQSGKTSKKVKDLGGSMKYADQESAALRAGMNALGTHMGIFTGKTIVMATAVYSTVTAIKTMLTVGSDFTKEMIRSSAVIGANAAEYTLLENKVRNLAKSTIYTSGEVAQGLTYLGMAGLTTKEALDALEPSLNIAKIGAISFSESADIVTNVLRGFKLEAEELSGVADDLATAITSSNATIQQLAKSLSYVAPLAASAGGSVREVVSILAVMHDVGIKSSRAGTALRRAYSNFLAPTKKVASALQRLNVQLTDGNGRMRAMTHILRDIVAAGSTSADTVDLFGVRAAAAMQAVLDDLRSVNPKLQVMLQKLKDNRDAAKTLGEAFEKYLGAEARKLVSALHDKMIDVFKANEQMFTTIIIKIKEFIQNLDTKKIGEFVGGIAKMVEVFVDLSVALSDAAGMLYNSNFLGDVQPENNVGTKKALSGINLLLDDMKKKADGAGKSLLKLLAMKFNLDSNSQAMGGFGNFFGGMFGEGINDLINNMYGIEEGITSVGIASENASAGLQNYNGEMTKMATLKSKLDGYTRSIPQELLDVMNSTNEWDVETTFVQQRMNQLETKEERLNMLESWISREMGKNQMILSGLGESNADKIVRQETLKLDESLQAMWTMIKQYKEQIQREYGDLMIFEVTPQDAINRKAFRDKLIGAMDTYDYEAEIDRVKEAGKRAEDRLKQLQEQGLINDEEFLDQLKRNAANTHARIKALYQTEMDKLKQEKKMLEDRIGVDDKTRDIPILGFSQYDNTPLYDVKTFDGGDRLIELYGEINELAEAIRKTEQEAAAARGGALHGYLMDLINDSKLFTAGDDFEQYNRELALSVEAQNKKNLALLTGDATQKEYLSTAQKLKDKEIEGAIATLESARAKSIAAGASEKLIAEYDKEIARLGKLRKEIATNTQALDDAKQKEDAIKQAQARAKELEKMDFLPAKIKARYDYEKDMADLDAFYEYKYGKYEEDAEIYAEYLEAKKLKDIEFWESQNEHWNTFFDSLGDNIAKALGDMIIYKESWADLRNVIAIGVAQSAIKALVDIGAEFMKFHMQKMFSKKTEIAADATNSAVRQGLMVKEAATQATATATAGAASAAAGAEAGGMISGLLGAGAAMASAWLPAATLVNIATMGAAAMAAMGTMALAQTTATAGALAQAVVGGAGSMAVEGRERGGLMQAGKPYLVGERGMELVVPKTNSMVVANKDLKNPDSPFNKSPDESGVSGDVRIVNAIDPEFIEDYLGSDEGERVILNVMRKNKGSFE